jgi:triosephosphate isomerase (TIM)
MANGRTPLIAGNWKMHKTIAESVDLAKAVVDGERRSDVDVLLGPPFTALSAVSKVVAGKGVYLAGQNCHQEKSGAYTGELSAGMLKDAGCTHVILGHSERRQLFGETDAGVNEKVIAVLNEGLIPILCVGETLAEREAEKTFKVLQRQLWTGLHGIEPEAFGKTVLAYEPVWAIGTGKTATPDQAQEVHHYLRELLAKILNKEVAKSTLILYGGSVKPGNIRELMSMDDVDGALVGGASLKASDFLGIINF